MINKYMRIDDIIVEHVDDADAFVNGAQIDPELLELKKRQSMIDQGIDPDNAEIVQDFPS
jgi:hypothetical protein